MVEVPEDEDDMFLWNFGEHLQQHHNPAEHSPQSSRPLRRWKGFVFDTQKPDYDQYSEGW